MTATRNRLTRQGVAERRAEALRLRRQGMPYAAIAERLHYASASAASRDVSRALEQSVQEEGKALLTLERERTDWLMAKLTAMVEDGSTHAAREMIRLLERRARMLGIDRAAQEQQREDDAEAGRSLIGRLTDQLTLYARDAGWLDDDPDQAGDAQDD